MNAAFIAIGAAFIAIGAAAVAKAKTIDNPELAKKKQLSGILFMAAAAAFFVAGLLPLLTD